MDDVKRFLDQACCGVGGSHELRRHLRKELQEHLTAEIERNVAAGMDQAEATQRALEEFGDPVMIREGLQSVHGRRLLSLLIEKSMIWKVRTMKTGWKWSFVACVALVLTIAIEVFLSVAPLMYIFPVIKDLHHTLGTPMFANLEAIVRYSGLLIHHFLWIPCVLPVLIGWVVFEWKYRGENKAIIRLASLSLLSFVTFLILVMICVPMTIDLAMLPRQIYDSQINLTPQQAERIVLPRISEANAAFKALGEAIDQGDWPALSTSADRLSDTCKSLHETSVSIMLLAGENQRDNLTDVRDLLDEIEKSSRKIYYRFGAYERSEHKDSDYVKAKAQDQFKQLMVAYQELGVKSDLFAARGQAQE